MLIDPGTASIASSALGGIASAFGASSANKSSKRQQAEAQRFNLMMAQNAHQFQVADLRAAGLNPRLSAMGGSGASASAAPPYNPKNELEAAPGVASSAMQALRLREEIKNLQESNKQISSQTKLNQAQSRVADQSAKSVMADWKLKAFQLPAARNNAEFETKVDQAGPFAKFLNQLLQTGNSAKSLAK